uniref:Polyketide synthase n=1 Tax=Pestalotiopsis microspora TaxID=85828 RepID=A0A1P8NTK9_PESMI|nr:polyketide synthase [Pestalotiopsis microspora]
MDSEPFAIIGLSLKLPQSAVDEPSLWQVLERGENLMTEWPEDRLLVDSFADGADLGKPNTIKGRGAHFIKEDPAVFDAPFFSITASEAASMDPQQRWALESAYHAFENAGIPMHSLRGSRTAVFAGLMTDDYTFMTSRDIDQAPRQSATGLSPPIIPNRISWYFGMHGPSVAVQTACSSGLVAVDMACQAMAKGDADMALVIGTSALLGPELPVMLSNMNFLSRDSRCYSFDARANGYARGEGVVALVIKPLARALESGDVIRSVVRATGQNQDGRTPTLTQPSSTAQEALIRQVYARAGLDFADTRYFEAHGTGTPTGDPIEMTGIGRVFRKHRSPKEPLYVGSIKANVGHLEGASGLAGLLKSVLVLEKGIIPRNALFEKMNPDIDAEFYNIQVPTENTPWPSSGLRRVSVSSYGFGGANAHAILDDAYHYLESRGLGGFHNCTESDSHSLSNYTNGVTDTVKDQSEPTLFVWSANDAGAVQRVLDGYREYFSTTIAHNKRNIERLAYTLAVRRSLMAWRTFAIVDTATGELSAAKAIRASSGLGLAFVFTGQGAQYCDMGLELLRYPVFEESLKLSDAFLTSFGCEWSVFDEIRNAEGINRPEASQPLTTVLQIALVQLLRSLGVMPAAVLGHSSGEIAAAYTIGALSHESACLVSYWRGQLAGKLRGTSHDGAMMSVNLSESQVPGFLEKIGVEKNVIHTACINSPTNVTLSGPSDVLDLLKEHLTDEQIFAQKLTTGVAYHSPAMQAVSAEYIERIGSLSSGEATGVPMISSVTGQLAALKLLSTPQYWAGNLVSPVRFSDAVQCLAGTGDALPLPPGIEAVTDILEVGPHSALRRPIRDTLTSISSGSGSTIRYHCTLTRSQSPGWTMVSLMGTLYCHGYPVSIAAANKLDGAAKQPFLVDCPLYPFDRSRKYWLESRVSKDLRLRPHSQGHLLGRRSNHWNALQPTWRNWLSVETMPWLADHVVNDSPVCPGTGMGVMVMEAAKQLASTGPGSRPISGVLLKNCKLLAPISVGEKAQLATETELQLRPATQAHEKEHASWEARLCSYRDGHWTENFRAQVHIQYEDANDGQVDHGREALLRRQQLDQLLAQTGVQATTALGTQDFYSYCASQGLQYGDAFRCLSEIRCDGRSAAIACLDVAETAKHYPANNLVNPSNLDAAVHLYYARLSNGLAEPMPTLVPQRVKSIWVSAKAWEQKTSVLRVVSVDAEAVNRSSSTATETNVYIFGDDGSPLVYFEHCVMAEVARPQDKDGASLDRPLLYGIHWKPQLSSLLSGPRLQGLFHQRLMPRCSDEPTCSCLLNQKASDDFRANMLRKWMDEGQFRHFLDLASHENPDLKVLEVGAGTAEVMRQVVAALQGFETETGQTRFAHYTFTDTSSDSLDVIREFEDLQDRRGRTSFQILTLDRDPVEEGFEIGSFDLIIAAGEIHDRAKPEETLLYLRSLLRPRGILVAADFGATESGFIDVGEVRASCSDSWNHSGRETEGQPSLLAREQHWDQLMRQTGFSGIELTIRNSGLRAGYHGGLLVTSAIADHDEDVQQSTALISDAQVLLIMDQACETQLSFATEIEKQCPSRRVELTELATNQDWTWPDNAIVICLLEIDRPRLSALSEDDFVSLRCLFSGCQQLLWVTSSTRSDPHYGMATGFLRSMRSEDANKRVVTLSLEHSGPKLDTDAAVSVVDVLRQCFIANSASAETEFVVCDGQLHIPRATREINLDHERVSRLHPQLLSESLHPGPPLMVTVGTPGLLDSLRLEEDPVCQDELRPDEVEVKAEAWVLNFRDVFIALGRLGSEKLGFDLAGTVIRVGSGCEESGLQPGDRVILGIPGCMRTHPRAPAAHVLKIPSALTPHQAASIMVPGVTAYQGLMNIARLQRGETILIHSAAGSTGQFAVGLARWLGAEVFATVGFDSKKQLLMDRWGIPEDHIFYSRDTSFAQGVMRMTHGRGVDVVFNSLSGDGLEASWECVAPYGRFIEIGKVDIAANSALPMARFAQNVTFGAVDMHHIARTNPSLLRQLMIKCLDLACRQDFIGIPTPIHVFPMSELEKAFRFVQSGKNSGRTIVTLEETEVVQKLVVRRSTWRFDQNSTYMVIGGLGGLGRPIIRWMADRGAKHLILPSRSGATSEAAINVVSELREKGVRVLAPRCNAAVANEVSATLNAAYSEGFPPVRGCINSSMDLQDSVFENMTYAQWTRSITSKVETSWTLHQMLPRDLDFFILLSSVAGIYGLPGQSNYAAGCAFQDALARHRTATGYPGVSVSLDLGWMRDDGAIHESADLKRRFTSASDMKPVATADLLAVLDHYCDPSLPSLDQDRSQLLIGLTTPDEVRAQASATPETLRSTRLFAGFDVVLANEAGLAGGSSVTVDDVAQRFVRARSAADRVKVVATALREKVARALGVEVDHVDSSKGLADYGVDSLMGVELRNWIRRDFGVSVAVFEIMQGGKTIEDVGLLVERKRELGI